MMFLSAWTKLIVVVVIVITMLKPTTAGLGTFLKVVNAKSVTCHFTNCTSDPSCAEGYNTLSTTYDGCPSSQAKKYCCQSGFEPQCFFTGCGKKTSCPTNYLELDRTKIGCNDTTYDQAYCCKTSNLPVCFELTCPTASAPAKSCPPEYNETERVKGGCGSDTADLVKCCQRENNGNQRSGNANNGAGVSLFSMSHAPFAVFVPTLIVLSAFKSKFILLF